LSGDIQVEVPDQSDPVDNVIARFRLVWHGLSEAKGVAGAEFTGAHALTGRATRPTAKNLLGGEEIELYSYNVVRLLTSRLLQSLL